MAVVQLAVMLNVPTASRAGSLPQLMVVGHKVCVRRRSLVGAGLLAKAMVQSAVMLNVPPLSRAGSLPQSTEFTAMRFLPLLLLLIGAHASADDTDTPLIIHETGRAH